MNYLDSKTESRILYKTEFEDGYVVWKLLPWREYKAYREATFTVGSSLFMQLEEHIFKRCAVFSTYDIPPSDELSPEDKQLWSEDCRADQPAGVISTVVKQILKESGSMSGQALERALNEQRVRVGDIEEQMIVLICHAFPSYKPEEVEELDWPTVCRRAAQAEMITGKKIERAEQPQTQTKQPPSGRLNLEKDNRELRKALGPQDEEEENAQSRATRLREQYFRNRSNR